MARGFPVQVIRLIVVVVSLCIHPAVRGDDCNSNGTDDICEIDCGEAGGPCDVPGCGLAEDCNGNLRPDSCDLYSNSQFVPFTHFTEEARPFNLVESQGDYAPGFFVASYTGLWHLSPDGEISLFAEGAFGGLAFAPGEFTGAGVALCATEHDEDAVVMIDTDGGVTPLISYTDGAAYGLAYVPEIEGVPLSDLLLVGLCFDQFELGEDRSAIYALTAAGEWSQVKGLSFCPYELAFVPDSFGEANHRVLMSDSNAPRLVSLDLLTLETSEFVRIEFPSTNFGRIRFSPVGWGGFLNPALQDRRVLAVAHLRDFLSEGTVHLFDAFGRRVARLNSSFPGTNPWISPSGIAFAEENLLILDGEQLVFASPNNLVIGSCNGNGIPDDCDLADGALDCNENGIIESCEDLIDCNDNGVQDRCDVLLQTSLDSDSDWLPNECEARIISSNPPNHAIDARQPFRPDGSQSSVGWRSFDLALDQNPVEIDLKPTDFRVSVVGGVNPPPVVVVVVPRAYNTARVFLDRTIEIGAWTTIEHIGSQTSVRFGFLPGDVNGDRMSNPTDLVALLYAMIAGGEPLPLYQTDLNRSGLAEPSDVLRLIDLLNGADAYPPFLEMALPE